MSEKKSKLIFINGPVAMGKSTLAHKYIESHEFALLLSVDDFVGSMGKWLENEHKARDLALKYVLLIAERHLKAGYDVVLPYLLANPHEMEAVEQVVKSSDALLFEFALTAPKEEAVARALERGTWGEPGAPLLTKEDRPIVEELFDKFQNALQMRPRCIQVPVEKGNVMGTYEKLMGHIGSR